MFFEWLGEESVSKEYKEGVDHVLDENDKGSNLIITSVITDLEVLPEKLDDKSAGASTTYNDLFDGEKFHQTEVNKNILILAREIRSYYFKLSDDNGRGGKMMDLGDSIHLASAIIHEVDEFHTRDKSSKGSKVPLVTLYENSGVNQVCGKYEIKIVSPLAEEPKLL